MCMCIKKHRRYFHYVGLDGTQPIRRYQVSLLSVSLKMSEWCVCLFAALDLGPSAWHMPSSLCDVCMWINTMAHVGGQSCGFQGSNSSCQSWARPFDCWAVAAATPRPLKKVLYCLTKLLRLTLNLQLCFLSCLSNWDYRSHLQAWFSCFTVDISHAVNSHPRLVLYARLSSLGFCVDRAFRLFLVIYEKLTFTALLPLPVTWGRTQFWVHNPSSF